MRIPAHWSKATAEDMDRDGKKVFFSCWRSSDHSQEEAHRSALAVAGKYKYKPAIQSGRPIAIWVTYKVDFKLD